MKKVLSLMLALAVFLTAFTGCVARPVYEETAEDNAEPFTLKVITEYGVDEENYGVMTTYEAMLAVIGEFRMEHPNVKVEVTALPTDKELRAITLQKIRTEMMAGAGPDVFLLPSGKVVADFYSGNNYWVMDPLFPDVYQCMKGRRFADLSEFYDNDTGLKTKELKKDVMDAGIYDGKRYVLPIGWNMPIVAYDRDRSKELGIDEKIYSKSFIEVYKAAVETEDKRAAFRCQLPPKDLLCCFSDMIDYDTGNFTIKRDDLVDFYTQVFNVRQISKGSPESGYTTDYVKWYIADRDSFILNGKNAFTLTTLDRAADILAMAEVEGKNVKILPLRGTDGKVVADVTYYGAVNQACKHKRAAYELVRKFLIPETQFQENISTGTIKFSHCDVAYPVRITGSLQKKLTAGIGQASGYYEQGKSRDPSAIQAVELKESMLPLLNEPIDHVTFKSPLSYEFNRSVKRVLFENNIEDLADEFIQTGKYFAAES